MDMDLDVAWCLTCSKRTNDSRNPYCSDECRAQDQAQDHQASGPSFSSTPITAPIPPSFGELTTPATAAKRRTSTAGPAPLVTPRALSPVERVPLAEPSSTRPPVTPLSKPSATATSSTGQRSVNARMIPRDRRAFSFPATQSSPPPPISIAERRNSRQSSAMALPFVRKTMGVSLTSTPAMNTPVKEGPTGTLRAPDARTAMLRQSKSTGGANTPLDPESVFCSTSESEGEGDLVSPGLNLLSVGHSVAALRSTVPSSVPLSRRSTKSRSSRPTPSSQTSPSLLERPNFNGRKHSQSPVAQLVASSASSRSREDIISWAKAVGWRPSNGETSEEGDESERGRSRTRRAEGLPSFTPVDDDTPLPEDRAGTTPKGGITSALAGLGIGGFAVGPIVKALTNTITPHPPLLPPSDTNNTLGGPSAAASPYVSTVQVTTFSAGIPIASSNPNDSDVPYHDGGATPTLSTISFSEAIEPSVNGTFDHAEIATDDAHSTASYVRRSVPAPPKLLKPPAAKQAPLPLRPITTTATAIWNLSTYIRSFSPFSISSVIAPYAPFTAPGDKKHPSGVATPAPIPEETEEDYPARASPSNPLPAARVEQQEEVVAPKEMVRSLPMDIVLPLNEAAIQAQKDKIIQREGRSPSRHRSRSGSRSRSTSSPRRHGRRLSYDADASDEDEEEVNDERRGRSRRGKVLAKDLPDRHRRESDLERPSMAGRRLSEGGMRVLGERSGSRGAGRRR